MKIIFIFIVASMFSALIWRCIDALYPSPEVAWWWCFPAALVGGLAYTLLISWAIKLHESGERSPK